MKKKICVWLMVATIVIGMGMPVDAAEPGGGITPDENTETVKNINVSETSEDESEHILEDQDKTVLEKEEKDEAVEKAERVEADETTGIVENTEIAENEKETVILDGVEKKKESEKIDVLETTQTTETSVEDQILSADETKAISYNLVLNPSEVTLKEGETCKLSVEIEPEEPEDLVYTFSTTNNGSVAFDEETMTITAVGAGKGSVSVKATYKKENGTTASTTRSCTVNVEKAAGDTEVLINGTLYLVDDSAEKSNLQQAVEAAGITDYRDITSIEFKNGVIRKDDFTYISSIEDTLQYGLKSFIIDDSVQVKGLIDNAIPNAAFQVNTTSYPHLTTVYLGVNIKKIEQKAFYGCSAITDFEAPGVEYIGRNALDRIKVTTLSLPSVTRLDEDAFGTGNKAMTVELYLPSLSTMGTSGGAYDALECFTGLQKLTLGVNPPKLIKALKLKNGVAENLELVLPRGAVTNYQTGEFYDAEANTWCGIKLPVQNQYTVTVDVDGESYNITLPYEYESLKDLMPEAPVKAGYVFLGWNTKADGSGADVTADTLIEGDTTIYAVFRQEYLYNVTFVIDGKETIVQVTESESILKLPSAPSKEGYVFKGWNTKADGTGAEVTDGMSVSSDMTVYAVFEKKSEAGSGDEDDKKPNTGTDDKTNQVNDKNKNDKEDKKVEKTKEKSDTKAVQTGDETTAVPVALLVLASGVVVVALSEKRRYMK